jgi:hypothetical protein
MDFRVFAAASSGFCPTNGDAGACRLVEDERGIKLLFGTSGFWPVFDAAEVAISSIVGDL